MFASENFTLETSGEDVTLHSKRVEKMCGKLHSKRVEKMSNYTRNEWRRCKTTLETSGEDLKQQNLKKSQENFETSSRRGLVF
jgi:hypothetical protein